MSPSGVSKASNAKVPILGQAITPQQNVWVPEANLLKHLDSSVPRVSVGSMIKQRALDTQMPTMAIAPEGTCGDGRSLLQFKTGAFLAGGCCGSCQAMGDLVESLGKLGVRDHLIVWPKMTSGC